MLKEKIKVVVVRPNEEARIEEIENTLEAKQEIVGGWIEAIYPYQDDVALICNEEGKITGMEPCRILKDETGEWVDVICGPFLIVGLTEDDFGGLSDDLAEKYCSMFKNIEYIKLAGI